MSREDAMIGRFILAGVALLIGSCGMVEAQQTPKIYNTAKQKLIDGKQVVGATIFSPDPSIFCATANAGFDFLWIEMQHSPLTLPGGGAHDVRLPRRRRHAIHPRA